MRPIPVAFHIWFIEIHTYGIGLALTFWFGLRYTERRLRNSGYPWQWVTGMFLWVIVAAIVGARALHVLSNLSYYSGHPGQIIAIWQGGLSSFGGLHLRRARRHREPATPVPGAAHPPLRRPHGSRAHGLLGHRPPARSPADDCRWWSSDPISGSGCTTPARSASGCPSPSSSPWRTSPSSPCSCWWSVGSAARPRRSRRLPMVTASPASIAGAPSVVTRNRRIGGQRDGRFRRPVGSDRRCHPDERPHPRTREPIGNRPPDDGPSSAGRHRPRRRDGPLGNRALLRRAPLARGGRASRVAPRPVGGRDPGRGRHRPPCYPVRTAAEVAPRGARGRGRRTNGAGTGDMSDSEHENETGSDADESREVDRTDGPDGPDGPAPTAPTWPPLLRRALAAPSPTSTPAEGRANPRPDG